MENPTTSKELKKRILFLEERTELDKQCVKAYIKPLTNQTGKGNLLLSTLQNVKLPMDLKSMAVKAMVSFVTGFLIKKLTAKKEVDSNKELSDQLVSNAIETAINRNSGKLSEQERKLFKKMLNQYLVPQ